MPNITIEFSQKALLEGTFKYLREHAFDSQRFRPVIADFVNQYLVAEIQRLDGHDGAYPCTLEITDADVRALLGQAPAPVPCQGMAQPAPVAPVTQRAPHPEVQRPAVLPDVPPAPVLTRRSRQTRALLEAAAAADVPQRASRTVTRNGNGHESQKRRPLSEREKDWLRAKFVAQDGIVTDDDCVAWTRYLNGHRGSAEPLSAFQVPGFVANPLHREVARGDWTPHNRRAYDAHLNGHRGRYPRRYPNLVHAKVTNDHKGV